MLEVVAMVLFALWVIGLITGHHLSGAVHFLLIGGLLAAYLHHRKVSRARSNVLMGSGRAVANAMGGAAKARKPGASPKSGSAGRSRPSAAA